MARKSSKPAVKDALIQRIDAATGAEVREWAVVTGTEVTGWTPDPHAATAMTVAAAIAFQVANEKRPDAEFVHCRLDQETLGTPGDWRDEQDTLESTGRHSYDQ